MGANLQGFDAAQVEPNVGFDPVPAGDYLVAIVESEMKKTKDEKGQFLEVVFEVLEGAHKGRKLYTRLNLDNPNQTAVAIAKGELSAICRAVGVMRPNDSQELHDLPLRITVGMEKRKDTGELVNRVKKYTPKGQGTPAAPAQASGAPPWARRQ